MLNSSTTGRFPFLILLIVALHAAGSNDKAADDDTAVAEQQATEPVLASLAEDASVAVAQRAEALESLTPQFTRLVHDWSLRQCVHEMGRFDDRESRLRAASDHLRRMDDVYQTLHNRTCRGMFDDPDWPQDHMTDYYLCEAALLVATAKALPSPAMREPVDRPPQEPMLAPLAKPARQILKAVRDRLEMNGGLTAESLTLLADGSRVECLTEAAGAAVDSPARAMAVRAHLKRLEELRARMKPALAEPAPDGSVPRHQYDYLVAEAKAWLLRETGGTAQDFAAARGAMADAARAQVSAMWKRRQVEGALNPESLEDLCLWSRRLHDTEMQAPNPQANGATPAQDHLRRMRELHADIRKRFDDGRDVSMVQVRQAEYFLHEAEAVVAARATD